MQSNRATSVSMSAGLFLVITTVLAFVMGTFVFVVGLVAARR